MPPVDQQNKALPEASPDYNEYRDIVQNSQKAWEQLDGESDSAYHAFYNFYLKTHREERTLNKAYEKYCVFKGKTVTNRIEVKWQEWYKTYWWRYRAEAWDEYLQFQIMEYVNHDQYFQLILFRKMQGKLSKLIGDAALEMIEYALDSLKELREAKAKIALRDIPNYIKVATQVAQTAQSTEAAAMALDQMIEKSGIDQVQMYENNDRKNLVDGINESTSVDLDLLEELEDLD